MNSKKVFLFLALSILVGCQGSTVGDRWWSKLPGYGGYWWQRGQPKSVETLHQEATVKFAKSVVEHQAERAEIVTITKDIEQKYQNILTALKEKKDASIIETEMTEAMHAMMNLEGKLSIGSRAAYGELSGQLRVFAEKVKSGQQFSNEAFGLYTARTLNFLSSELSMPKPVIL